MGRKSPEQEDAIRPDEVRLGRVSGVFGVSGELRLFLHNRESELFAGDGAVVTLVSPSGNRESHRLRSRHGAGKRILGRIEGVTSPESARRFMDWEIVLAETALPATGEDEYYQRDLIGLPVRTRDGSPVGTVTEVLEGPVVDCWVIKGPEGEQMFPAVKDVVVSVDLNDGIVIADPIQEFEA